MTLSLAVLISDSAKRYDGKANSYCYSTTTNLDCEDTNLFGDDEDDNDKSLYEIKESVDYLASHLASARGYRLSLFRMRFGVCMRLFRYWSFRLSEGLVQVPYLH